MEIVKIDKTRLGRYSLFNDDGFLFSVDEETLFKSKLDVGSIIDDVQLYELKLKSDTRKAKDKAIRYLSLRAYAEKELYEKLSLKFDRQTSAAVIAELIGLGLLDDIAFAEAKAKGMALRKKSRFEIKRKLIQTGIDNNLAEIAIDEAEIDDFLCAVALIEKMYIEKLKCGERQKVMAALARRGFSHRDLKGAIEQVESEFDEEFE